MNQLIIDSALTLKEAIAQNPQNPAPPEVVCELTLIELTYYSYDTLLHRGQLVIHKALEEDVTGFFAHAHELAFPIEKVIPIAAPHYAWNDERSCEDNNSSGYNYRFIMGMNRLSKHARGMAFDINPRENVYIRYDEQGNEVYRLPATSVYDENARGTLTQDHPLVTYMRARGWIWGGDWKPERGAVDYQHFEKEV